jgi:hypothetical protein
MKRYWTRIGLGALGIFILGMLIVSAGRRGVDRVKELALEHSVRLPANFAPFRVDEHKLGSLTLVRMDPQPDRSFPYINLTVQSDPGADPASLGDCRLVATDEDALQGQGGLHCSESMSSDSMVEMGTVTFEPSGQVFPIYVPNTELSGKGWFSRRGHETSIAPATVSQDKGSVNLKADASGAFMLIRDERGKPVFQLNADSNGAFIQVRDSNGKEVLRFRADSQGVVGRAGAE